MFLVLHSQRWLEEQQRRFSTELKTDCPKEARKQKGHTDKHTQNDKATLSSMYVGLLLSILSFCLLVLKLRKFFSLYPCCRRSLSRCTITINAAWKNRVREVMKQTWTSLILSRFSNFLHVWFQFRIHIIQMVFVFVDRTQMISKVQCARFSSI